MHILVFTRKKTEYQQLEMKFEGIANILIVL